MILKTLQKYENCQLGVEMTNINIWALLSSSPNFLKKISNCLQMTLATPPNAFNVILRTPQIFEISHFGYKWPWDQFAKHLK